MIFRGLVNYRTADPRALNQDLQRQNLAVGEALTAVVNETVELFKIRKVSSDTSAALGDFVIADTTNRNVTIKLPLSSPSTAGERVAVGMSANAGAVFVRASGGNTIGGIDTYTLSTSGILIEFVDDGLGSWWVHG